MRVIKSRLFIFITTAIIFTGVGVFAESLVSADKISYKNGTVESALNDLYSIANTDIVDRLSLTATANDAYGVRTASHTATLQNVTPGKYLVIGTSGYTNSSTNSSASSSMTTASLPSISTTDTNASCTDISRIRERSGATEAIATNVYLFSFTYSRVWLCNITTTSNISMVGTPDSSEVASNNKFPSAVSVQAIKLK